MDVHPTQRKRLDQRQMWTEEEMANYILNPDASIERGTATRVQYDLFHLFDRERRATGLRSVKDNLERIRAFKGRWLHKLTNILDKDLFLTRGWIDLLSKNEAVADLLRRRGNEYFIKRNFDMALRAYTLTATYSPKGSKSLALAFSNRSACFAETKRWNKCLEDISRFEAIWNRIEKGFTLTGYNVTKRKEKCLKEIGDKKEGISLEKKFGNDFFKLKSPSADLPFLEDFLGVKTDPKKGRGIYNISDKAIEPGTLLILDESYSHVHFRSIRFQTKNCSACFRLLDGGGIPCGGCVFNLYCSEACATSDRHDIHAKYECKMAPYLYEVLLDGEFYSNPHLALLILLKLGPQALLDHYRLVFNNNGDNEDKGGSTSSYLPIYNLICHDEIHSEEVIFECSKYAVMLTETLDFSTDYFSCLNLDELEVTLLKEEFARRLLLHQLCLKVNVSIIGLPDRESQDSNLCDLGYGVYSAVSLINHSCAPNARLCSLPGGVMAVIALEYVVPGQEILVNYLHSFRNHARDERRNDLMRIFGFKCECPACTGNWTATTFKKSSQTFGTGFICPCCRKKFEAFNEIYLEYVDYSDLILGCPRECGFKILQDDIETKFNYNWELGRAALKSMEENRVMKGFMDAKKGLQFFDAHFPKPNKQIYAAVEIIMLIMDVIARKMFE